MHETNETETKWKSRNRRRTTLARMGKAGTRPPGSSYVAGSQTCACLSARGILGILHPPFMTLHTFRLYVASFHFICNFFPSLASSLQKSSTIQAEHTRLFASQCPAKLLQSKKKRERQKLRERWPQKSSQSSTHTRRNYFISNEEKKKERKKTCVFSRIFRVLPSVCVNAVV